MTTIYHEPKPPSREKQKPIVVKSPKAKKQDPVKVVIDKGVLGWFARGLWLGGGFSVAVLLLKFLQGLVV